MQFMDILTLYIIEMKVWGIFSLMVDKNNLMKFFYYLVIYQKL
jgi:hypothetical protein